MKFICLAIGMAMIIGGGVGAGAAADEGDGHTTVVRDANGVAVITQSGDPDKAEVRVEQTPGRTTVYRRSGGNTAILTQGTSPPEAPQDVPEWMQRLLRR